MNKTLGLGILLIGIVGSSGAAHAQCTMDSDCPNAISPKCDVGAGACVPCLSDADCMARARPACDTATNTCVACVTDSQGCGCQVAAGGGSNLVVNSDLDGPPVATVGGTVPASFVGVDDSCDHQSITDTLFSTPAAIITAINDSANGGTHERCFNGAVDQGSGLLTDPEEFGQSVSGLSVGETYFVSFEQSHTGFDGNGVFPMLVANRDAGWEVRVDGNSIGSASVMDPPVGYITVPGPPEEQMHFNRWECAELSFEATAATQLVSFVPAPLGLTGGVNEGAYLMIDDIRISTEPRCPSSNVCLPCRDDNPAGNDVSCGGTAECIVDAGDATANRCDTNGAGGAGGGGGSGGSAGSAGAAGTAGSATAGSGLAGGSIGCTAVSGVIAQRLGLAQVGILAALGLLVARRRRSA